MLHRAALLMYLCVVCVWYVCVHMCDIDQTSIFECLARPSPKHPRPLSVVKWVTA